MYNLKQQGSSYSLQILPLDDFTVILKDDEINGQGLVMKFLNEVSEIFDIEFNGHFGNFIYYSVSSEDDKPSLHEKIKNGVKEIVDNLRQNPTSTL